MSQSSSNSDQQPESSKPRIDQHSSGNLDGGQQAAIGDGNVQFQDYSTTNIYLGLQDKDLEPLSLWGKILSYFKVFIFLVIILIFWAFFGLFTSFPFPYGEAIDLMLCCFKGTVASKVNILQKRSQLENLDSQSVQKLNNLDFQVRLYLGVLKYLGANKAENHERLAKTIESLKHKKYNLQDEIKPNQPKKYRTVTRIQDFFESITLSQAERDLIRVESILSEVTWAIKNNYPSETIVQDTIDRLSRETTRRADKISPFRIGILYRIETLLREVSDKEISNLGESELNELNKKTINGLKEEKDTLSREVNKLRDESYIAQQRLREYLEELGRLNSLLDERESDLSKLRENLRGYVEANQSKQFEIDTLNSEFIRVDKELGKLQAQKRLFSEEINRLNQDVNRLNQDVNQKKARIDQLTNQLNQHSQMRTLNGDYIGNLSETKSRYHFNQKCNHWKMLVGEYVLKLDVSRKITSSDTPTLFIREGLRECDICAGRNTQNRRA